MAYRITYKYPRQVFDCVDEKTGEAVYKIVPAEKSFTTSASDLETDIEAARLRSVDGEVTVEEISDPQSTPTQEEDTAAMLVDHEFRLTLLELGLNE